jgi:hypothetical protein
MEQLEDTVFAQTSLNVLEVKLAIDHSHHLSAHDFAG